MFGVDFSTEDKAAPLDELTVARQGDDVEIVDAEQTGGGNRDEGAAAEGAKRQDREVMLSPELGLAIEKLPEGFSAKSLWGVV